MLSDFGARVLPQGLLQSFLGLAFGCLGFFSALRAYPQSKHMGKFLIEAIQNLGL
jgi:hypothetical protein